jgi:hypothetical protein
LAWSDVDRDATGGIRISALVDDGRDGSRLGIDTI